MVSPAFQFLPANTWLYSYCGTISYIQNSTLSKVKVCTSSKELTANPWAFIIGRTWAANARRSWRASSCCSGLVGSAVMKFMWWFGLGSAWFSRTWTIVGVVLCQIMTQIILTWIITRHKRNVQCFPTTKITVRPEQGLAPNLGILGVDSSHRLNPSQHISLNNYWDISPTIKSLHILMCY